MTAHCRWAGSNRRRVVADEHYDGCEDAGCQGCWPCMEDHCTLCGITHLDDGLTCARCVGNVRDDLELIVDMHARLEQQAIVTGMHGDHEETVLGGDAMVMLAMTYRDQTGAAAADHSHESWADPVPPLLTLATWEDAYRDALEHEPAGTATVEDAADYLAQQLTYIAQWPEIPFPDFARDVRQARGKLEDVLTEGERRETGAPCPKCSAALVKDYGLKVKDDKWVCPRCKAWYSDEDYRKRVTDDYRANADRLTAPDIQAQYRVPAGSVRGWATLQDGEVTPKVRKRGKDSSGRQLYDVADVLAWRDRKQPA